MPFRPFPPKLRTLFAALGLLASAQGHLAAQEVQFVFTSDAHYGILRKAFRGARNVDAHVVNAALVAGINTLPGLTLPADGGVRAGQPVGAIDFVVQGGDLTNRQEKGGQSATASWAQFKADYLDGLEVKDGRGRKAPLFLLPGNHDASNAIGYWKPLQPSTDATVLVEIYNRMLAPVLPKTVATYRYATDPIHYSRTFGGIHFVFVGLWLDRSARAWLEQDLQTVSPSTPVLLFAHDPPALPTEQLTNPHGRHDLNATDRFENLVLDQALEANPAEPSTREQQELTTFLKAHANLTAWFHGHTNWQEAYTWGGAEGTLALPTFRVDSPLKGRKSAKDETKLSFQLVTLDAKARRMTVRECLWNAGSRPQVVFGEAATVSLEPPQVEP